MHSMDEKGTYNIIQQRAAVYLNSFPGPNSAGCNTAYHSKLRRFVDGVRIFNADELSCYGMLLAYRSDMMELATALKNHIGLDFADCDKYDLEQWFRNTIGNEERQKRYFSMRNEVFDMNHFFKDNLLSWGFGKPIDYLSYPKSGGL